MRAHGGNGLAAAGAAAMLGGMAWFGAFSRWRIQVEGVARFAPVVPYVAEVLTPGTPAHGRLLARAAGETGRVELGGGCFALEQAGPTRARSAGRFESHRRYVDVQVVVAGVEGMEVADVARLRVDGAYDAERDLLFYADPGRASTLEVRAGELAVFFPEDGHMPSLRLPGAAEFVRKTVIKVPVVAA